MKTEIKDSCGTRKMAAMREEVMELLAKQAEHMSGRAGLVDALKGEAPSALMATVGAGAAGYLGMNPLAGAGLGYGVGAMPEIYHGFKEYLQRRGGKVK